MTPLRGFRVPKSIAASLIVVLVAGLIWGLPPAAVAQPGNGNPDKSVPVSPVGSKADKLPQLPDHVPGKVTWPSPGSAVVELPAVAAGARTAAVTATVGGLPVRISPVVADEVSGRLAAAPSKVRVEVLDQASARLAGAAVAVKVSRADGGSGAARVNVALDYNAFRHAYGGAWAARLGLRQIPSCGLGRVPAAAAARGECAGISLSVDNDFRAGVLSAELDLAAPLKTLSARSLSPKQQALQGIEPGAQTAAAADGVSVLAVTGGGSAAGVGTFSKTDLKASYAWNAGANTGNFNFNYPMGAPPVPGGLAPQLGLNYSSQARRWTDCGGEHSVGAGGGGLVAGGGRVYRVVVPLVRPGSGSSAVLERKV